MNTALVAFVSVATLGALRLGELVYAHHRAAGLLARGARFVRRDGYAFIVGVQILLLAGSLVEAVLRNAALGPWQWLGAVLLVLGVALRYWSMAALGPRWSTRVFVLPDPLVAHGPYQFLRHPIYVGVTLEGLGLPILSGAWVTLAVVVPLHAWATLRRIAIEERALGLRGTPQTVPDRS